MQYVSKLLKRIKKTKIISSKKKKLVCKINSLYFCDTMKKQFQILFTLLSLFLLNGNGFLYANTYQHTNFSLGEKSTITNSFEIVDTNLEKQSIENKATNSFSNQTNFDALISFSRSHPVKNKNKAVELSNFVKKEEKIKPIVFKYITVHTVFTSFYTTPFFNNFHYSKKPSLKNYFKSFIALTFKRYLLLQVFRI